MEGLLNSELSTMLMPIIFMAMGAAFAFVWGKAKELAAASPNKIDDEVIRVIEEVVGNSVDNAIKKNTPAA